jgi:integrase
MSGYVAMHNKPSERASKRSILDHHLLPTFGPQKLSAITTEEIDHFKESLHKNGTGRKRINNILIVLGKVLRFAHERGVLSTVPPIKLLKLPPQKFDFFTFEEFESLVSASASEPEWQALILTAGEAGLRLGELLALHWSDIDWRANKLTVMRSDWRGQVGAPKSGSARVVPLTQRLAAALKAHRHQRSELVFPRADGAARSNTNMRAGLKRQAKRAGLRVTGWHVLRHTFCSHLAMHGTVPGAIQKLAGHASISVTEKYMHLARAALVTAIGLLDWRADNSSGCFADSLINLISYSG